MKAVAILAASAVLAGSALTARAADDSKVKAATQQVETGAKKIGDGKIGEGVEQTAKGHPYIVRRPTVSGGEPIIRGTRISVRHLVERIQAGQSIEDILAALPHLTAAQVYAALSYYHDHQSEMDQLIEEGRPERVSAAQGLKVEKVAEGVAIAHDHRGQW